MEDQPFRQALGVRQLFQAPGEERRGEKRGVGKVRRGIRKSESEEDDSKGKGGGQARREKTFSINSCFFAITAAFISGRMDSQFAVVILDFASRSAEGVDPPAAFASCLNSFILCLASDSQSDAA